MVLLLTDAFLLLTQVMLWVAVIWLAWFLLRTVLNKEVLGWLVIFLIAAILLLSFVQGGIDEPGSILEVLWGLISFPLSPFGFGLILLLVLLSGIGGNLSKTNRRIIMAGLILLALSSTPLVSYFLAHELETEAIAQVERTLTAIPALPSGAQRVIVLLGRGTTRLQLSPRSGSRPTDSPNRGNDTPPAFPLPWPRRRPITETQFQILSQLPVQLTEQGDRILYTAQLYREEAQRDPLIVVSAGRRPDRRWKDGDVREEISEARDIQKMLTQPPFGIPANNILLDHDNGNIHRSAEEVETLLRDAGINYGNQIMLVTSALNMNRSAWIFKQVFDGEEPSQESCIISRPTDFYTIPTPEQLKNVLQGRDLIEREFRIVDLLPTAEAFYISSKALQEYLGALYHFLRGWIRPIPDLGACPIILPGDSTQDFRPPPGDTLPSPQRW
ncbi:MAG: YdcF family protein [Leptolyngbyaceae cyanobacterium RU_5_1]|nr:YdcF family protein [Leptolyngbyaceae cyanobacterium RU_5_1]